jgi:hypothetical protein
MSSMRKLIVTLLAIFARCTNLAVDSARGLDTHYACERHRRPLVRQRVFTLAGKRSPTIDLVGDAQRLTEANPHSLYPFASQHQSKEFPQPAYLWYCPECEKNVLVGLARLEARSR